MPCNPCTCTYLHALPPKHAHTGPALSAHMAAVKAGTETVPQNQACLCPSRAYALSMLAPFPIFE